MSDVSESIIDFCVFNIPDVTKIDGISMSWDGSSSTMGFLMNPDLLVNGIPSNPISQVILVGHILLFT